MREPLRDKERLIHIKEAISRIKAGTSADNRWMIENSLEYFGLVKLIEIIGEAVYMLSSEFKEANQDIPWRQIERMRHVLVHGYYTVGIEFIKEVVVTDLPVLQHKIDKYIASFQ